MPATQAQPTFPQAAERAALKRWQIETLTGLHGLDTLEKQAAISQANQEAEGRWARKHLWGQEETPTPPADDKTMGHILGDVTYPTPVVVTAPPAPAQSQLGTAALIAASMLGTGGLAGVAGYLLNNKPAAVQPAQTYEDESVSIRLGRIEEFSEK